jgi:lysozyme
MAMTPGIDVSRWQGMIDWNLVAAAGYRFAFIRATVGDFKDDQFFVQNWNDARTAGLLVSAYHVVTPHRPVGAQVERFFDMLAGRTPDLPLVLDVERDDDENPASVTSNIRGCADGIEARAGQKPIIYTAGWFWLSKVERSPIWAQYDLWVANYGVSQPNLPADWQSWRFWQHTNRGRVQGVSSEATDLNWFNGDYEDLVAYAGLDPDDRPEPVIGPQVRVTLVLLSIRNGPSMNNARIGDLSQNDTLSLNLLDGDDIWIEFSPGMWAPMVIRGKRFLDYLGLQARVRVPFLDARDGPSEDHADIGDLHAGDVLNILNIDGQDVWVEFEPGRWVPFKFRGVQFLEFV